MPRKVALVILVIFTFLFAVILCGCNTQVTEVSATINYDNVLREVPFGTEFSLAGLEVRSKLSDGTYRTVPRGGTTGYTVDDGGYEREVPGEYTITITYKDFDKAIFIITILEEEIIDESQLSDIVLIGIKIREHEGKRIFNLGEEFAFDDMVVEEVYSDDSTKIIQNPQLEVNDEEYDANTVGTYTIIVRYYIDYNMFDTYTVTVIQPIQPDLIDLIIRTEHAKMVYRYGEPFTADGLIVEKIYKNIDGAFEPVIADFDELTIDDSAFYAREGVHSIGFSDIVIGIKNTDTTATYTVERIDYINAISFDIKLTYDIGEELAKDGIRVYISTAAGDGWEDENLDNYELDDSNYNPDEAGTYTIKLIMIDDPDIYAEKEVQVKSPTD